MTPWVLALAAAAAVAPSGVRQEAHQRLLAELARTARPAAAPVKGDEPRVDAPPPIFVTPHEDPVGRFFRTGILVGDHSPQPAKKISVGPCEGGQLLNLRSSW